MGSICIAVPPEVAAALDALDAAVAMIGEMNLDNYGAGCCGCRTRWTPHPAAMCWMMSGVNNYPYITPVTEDISARCSKHGADG